MQEKKIGFALNLKCTTVLLQQINRLVFENTIKQEEKLCQQN